MKLLIIQRQAAQISNEVVEAAKRTNETITTLGESSKEKRVGEISQNISGVSTTAEETTQSSPDQGCSQ